MTTDLHDAAWHVVTLAWVARWSGILGAGMLPALLAVFLPRVRAWRHYQVFRQATALLALVQCIFAVPLCLDSVLLDMKSPVAIKTADCVISSAMQADGLLGVRCDGDEFYARGVGALSTREGTPARLYRLRTSGVVVGATSR